MQSTTPKTPSATNRTPAREVLPRRHRNENTLDVTYTLADSLRFSLRRVQAIEDQFRANGTPDSDSIREIELVAHQVGNALAALVTSKTLPPLRHN